MPTSKNFSDVILKWVTIFIRRSTGEFNRFMKELGISMPQFHTMIHIYFDGPTGVSAIAQDVGFTKAASSQMIDRLVRMGLVTRTENPEDRRERQIDLTPKGRETLESFIHDNQVWMEKLAAGMPSDKQADFIQAFNLIIAEAAKDGEEQS